MVSSTRQPPWSIMVNDQNKHGVVISVMDYSILKSGWEKEKVVIFPISWSRSHPHWEERGRRKKGEGRPRQVTSRHCYQFKTGNTSIVMDCNVASSGWGPALPGVTVTASREREISSVLSHSTDPGCRNINRYFLQIRPLCSSLCLILAAVRNAQHVQTDVFSFQEDIKFKYVEDHGTDQLHIKVWEKKEELNIYYPW